MRGTRGIVAVGALALAAAVVAAPAGASNPTISISGTVVGHTETPDRTAPVPGDDFVAAATDCEAEEREIPGGFGPGTLFRVDADGSYSGQLVAGCDYDVLAVASPCGGPGTQGVPEPVSASAPVEKDFVLELPNPQGQPSEPSFDPSPGYTMSVVDTTRGIDVWPCRLSATRTLHSTVIIPQGQGPYPVVVLAHGLGNSRLHVHESAKGYPPRGYIVVAPTFPVVSQNAHQETAPDVRNQPGDVSFVVRAMLRAAATPGDPLYGKVDAEHIGVDGVSGGAVTALMMFNDCCRDPRIKAIAANLGYFVPADTLGTPYRFQQRLPLFMSNNVRDGLIPYDLAVDGWERARPDKFLASEEYDGCFIAHCTTADGAGAGRDLFFDAYLKGDAAAKAALIQIFQTSTATVDRQYVVGGGGKAKPN